MTLLYYTREDQMIIRYVRGKGKSDWVSSINPPPKSNDDHLRIAPCSQSQERRFIKSILFFAHKSRTRFWRNWNRNGHRLAMMSIKALDHQSIS